MSEVRMKRFEIAHIKEQGVDLIIVPLHPSFAAMNPVDHTRFVRLLQQAAISAGLLGTVIPVWGSGSGRMGFLAPTPMHPFLLSIDLVFVEANINRELTLEQPPKNLMPARELENVEAQRQE